MRNRGFISVDQLNQVQLMELIATAQLFSNGKLKPAPQYAGKAIAQLFCENSTRTRVSFELAAKQLGLHVVNVDTKNSSIAKGETLIDTALTLEAMGFAALVMRHQDAEILRAVHEQTSQMALINAGAGIDEHPSQMLLDNLTILQKKSRLEGLKIAIIGDIYHSRVAASNIKAWKKLGVKEIRCLAPELWLPSTRSSNEGTQMIYASQVDGYLNEIDVIMTLRVQQERIESDRICDLPSYIQQFQLTPQRLGTAKPDAIVMHPGPVNRGIEIDSELVDGPQSAILDQVKNGVFARMAILHTILSA